MIGEVLEKYEVLEKIGEGGMATVYRARHTTLHRTVAVKVLHPHLTSSEKNRKRFAREARAIESLRHPNILRIFDYSGPGSETCFIVTEYIEGPTLRALLEDVGAMMAEPASLLALGLCRALRTAHGKQIIHRDLKPENIMLTRNGEVKLMDFGIARLADDAQVTMTGALVGSPAYMSPEQATSQELDARSDLFTLGTVLYRMVTGRLPFQGTNPSIVLKNIIDGVYDEPMESVPSLSPRLARVIKRLLAHDPGERFESAEEVEHELTAFLRSVGIDPDAPGSWALLSYLKTPEEYEEELRTALIDRLVARGREESERGTTAEALSTFNRVLALDSNNTEVIDILRSIRPIERPSSRRLQKLIWVSPFLILAAVGVGLLVTPRLDAPPAPQESLLLGLRLAPMPAIPAGEAPQEPATTSSESSPPSSPIRESRTPRVAPTPRTASGTPKTPSSGKRTESATPRSTGQPREADVPVSAEPLSTPEDSSAVSGTSQQLEPALEGTGRLRVISTGSYLTVRVNGKAVGYTPVAPMELEAGDHLVEIEESEFTLAQRIEVRLNPEDERTLRLAPSYKPSFVQLAGFPAAARVVLDGSDRGTERRLQLDEARTYAIDVFLDDNRIQTASVVRGVERGQLLPGKTRVLRHQSSGSEE